MSAKRAVKEKLVPNWQVTATTISCDIVGHEATIMVYKDWSTACAYHKRWGSIRREKKKGIAGALAWLGIGDVERHIPVDCKGPAECPKVLEYRDKLYREEEEIAAK
jgi:hypothetical protein